MTEAYGSAVAEKTSGRGQSLLTTLKALVEGLDYDPQEQTYAAITELVDSVSRLEARLTVLEEHDGNMPARALTVTQERE